MTSELGPAVHLGCRVNESRKLQVLASALTTKVYRLG